MSRGIISRYVCMNKKCGELDRPAELFRWDDDPMPKCEGCGRPLAHFHDQMQHQTGCDFYRPILSEAMGVHVDQVAEHRRLHPSVPMTDDGRVVIKSHRDGQRIRKSLGFFDKSGYTR